MNLKSIAVLFALTLPLAACGNKGPLVLPTPVAPAAQDTPIDPAPAATDVIEPADDTLPADTDTTPVPEPDPATDRQDG